MKCNVNREREKTKKRSEVGLSLSLSLSLFLTPIAIFFINIAVTEGVGCTLSSVKEWPLLAKVYSDQDGLYNFNTTKFG